MNKNVGSVDRIVRIIAGVALLSLVVVGPKTLWGLIGIIPLFTATVRWCPLYTAVGVNTGAK